jgi:hypothetical protein
MNGNPMPPVGQMYLYDYIEPPLKDNSYQFQVNTSVQYPGQTLDVPEADSYFDVVGPRFRVDSTQVGTLSPPRNGHGDFSLNLPHIALPDRTLPWERVLDPANKFKLPAAPLSVGPSPWVALLLFEEGEYTLLGNQPVENVLPPEILTDLGVPNPSGIRCDAVQTTSLTLYPLLPSWQELPLLCHVRQVNTNDRELSVGSSNGWFSVVMSNRLPAQGAKFRACLVSLEGRSDIYNNFPAPGGSKLEAKPQAARAVNPKVAPAASPVGQQQAEGIAARTVSTVNLSGSVIPSAGSSAASRELLTQFGPYVFGVTINLVLLFSWQFECTGDGTFRELAQNVDVAMIGSVAEAGHPVVTDTGHIPMSLMDRAGAPETVLYRGPLSPLQLTRDTLGPFHCADQARLATPETGMEDVSYASAFEVGRLLAAADGRLAQELMRWRRNAYSASAKSDALTAVQKILPTAVPLDIHVPVTGLLGASAGQQMVDAIAPGDLTVVDAYRAKIASRAPGLDPVLLQMAWGLQNTMEAVALLGGNAGILGATVSTPAQTTRGNTTLNAVAADSTSLQRLSDARTRLLANASAKLGGTS